MASSFRVPGMGTVRPSLSADSNKYWIRRSRADRLSLDPVMPCIVGGHAVTKQAASTSQMGRFETEALAIDANVEALADMNGVWIDKVHDRHPPT